MKNMKVFDPDNVTESTITQLRLRAAREALRPSRQFPVTITPRFSVERRTVYDINYSGIYASGSSPEEACRNFDRVWRDGEHE
jgi:hypothetical protein